jgi:hypothetical protein
MIDTTINLTKEDVEEIVKSYQHDKIFTITLFLPAMKDSDNYRIKLYHKKYKRTIIVSSTEEFLDILKMYHELEKL